MYCLSSVCFICFSNNNLKKVFCGNKIDKHLKFLLPELTNKKSIPTIYMCSTCYVALSSAYAFKTSCLQKYYRFNNYINVLQGTGVTRNQRNLETEKRKATKNNAEAEDSCDDENTEAKKDPLEEEEHQEDVDPSERSLENEKVIYFKVDAEAEDPLDEQAVDTSEGILGCDVKNELGETANDDQATPGTDSGQSDLQEEKSIKRLCYKCTICEKLYLTKKGLILHLKNHAGIKDFCCDICDKYFKQKHDLVIHKKRHTGIKHFTCEICNKPFLDKRNLRLHGDTHSGVKKFICSICGQAFLRKDYLKSHMEYKHSDNRFSCPLCSVKVKWRYRRVHMKHHGEKQKDLKCLVCGIQYFKRSSFMFHLKTHVTNTKKFNCDICNKVFLQLDTLVIHKNKNHCN